MPVYEFKCPRKGCQFHKDEYFSTSEVLPSLNNKAVKKDLGLICPTHNIALDRVYSVPAVITNQSTSLQKKQQQRKTRSRAHFKNEVLPTIKDPAERRHFEKKYKNTKNVDHTKL